MNDFILALEELRDKIEESQILSGKMLDKVESLMQTLKDNLNEDVS